jgi:FMN phosphatase YigB (HAD superfamily)
MSVNHSLTLTNSAAKKRTTDGWKQTRKSTGSISCRQRSSSSTLAIVVVLLLSVLCLQLEQVQAFASLASVLRSGTGGGHVGLGQKRLVGALALSENNEEEDGGDASSKVPRLGFLSFDLDDTLFPTSQVVNSANNVMVQQMQSLGFETTVPDFLQQTRQIRSKLSKPSTYTALRRLAIRGEMERLVMRKDSDDDVIEQSLVDEMYNVWEQERHAAAEKHLFPDAIEMLQAFRKEHPDICIAAITNGAGNPLEMADTLEPFFEFCVSGEDDDVHPNRKPHPEIYEIALQRYESLYPHHFQEAQDGTFTANRIWCHVGDCLANDVGASAACGAYAVWMYTELEEETAAGRLAAGSKKPLWSTASASDMQQRAELANRGKEKVAVRISSLSELVGAIDELLQGASVKQLTIM